MNHVYIKQNPIPNSQSLINEAQGLETLRESLPEDTPLRVVQVHKVTRDELHLEKINSRPPTQADHIKLAQGLIQVHQATQNMFGLNYENFIGMAPQPNTLSRDWGHFFYHNRLWTQVERLIWQRERDHFFQILEQNKTALLDFVNDHKPQARLIHGDLWSGNILYDDTGPVLIDPAISYSDPECDLAMTKLFGKLPDVFYQEYRSKSSWECPADEKKLHQIYNLYHLLNHANLFGSSYLPPCREAARLIHKL